MRGARFTPDVGMTGPDAAYSLIGFEHGSLLIRARKTLARRAASRLAGRKTTGPRPSPQTHCGELIRLQRRRPVVCMI